MAQPEVLDAPPIDSRWAAPARIRNRLSAGIARVPATLRTKLLAAFLAIAALLVLVTVLGLHVLAQANARVERISALQLHQAQYELLAAEANDLRQGLSARASGNPNVSGYTGDKLIPGGKQWYPTDLTVNTLASQVYAAFNEYTFGFKPPPADEQLLQRIRDDWRKLDVATTKIEHLDHANVRGFRAVRYVAAASAAGDDLNELAASLNDRTSSATRSLAATNRSAYRSSRDLFIGVS